jgi:hypothetical protein
MVIVGLARGTSWDVGGRGSASRSGRGAIVDNSVCCFRGVCRAALVCNSRTCAGPSAWRRPDGSSHVWVVIPVRDPGALDGERRKRPCVVSVVAGRVSSSPGAWMPIRTVGGDIVSFRLLVERQKLIEYC